MTQVPLGYAFITELMQTSTCMLHAHTRVSNHVEHSCNTAAQQYLRMLLHSAPIRQQRVMHFH